MNSRWQHGPVASCPTRCPNAKQVEWLHSNLTGSKWLDQFRERWHHATTTSLLRDSNHHVPNAKGEATKHSREERKQLQLGHSNGWWYLVYARAEGSWTGSKKLPRHHPRRRHGLLLRRRVHPARAGGQDHVRLRPQSAVLVRRRRHRRGAPAARWRHHGLRWWHGLRVRRPRQGPQGAQRALLLRHGHQCVDPAVLRRRRPAAPELPLHGGRRRRGDQPGVRLRRVRQRRQAERPVGLRRRRPAVGGAAAAGGGMPAPRRPRAGRRRREGVGGVRLLRSCGARRRALLRSHHRRVGHGRDHRRQAHPAERAVRRRGREEALGGVRRRGRPQRPRPPRRRQVLRRGLRAGHRDRRVGQVGRRLR